MHCKLDKIILRIIYIYVNCSTCLKNISEGNQLEEGEVLRVTPVDVEAGDVINNAYDQDRSRFEDEGKQAFINTLII